MGFSLADMGGDSSGGDYGYYGDYSYSPPTQASTSPETSAEDDEEQQKKNGWYDPSKWDASNPLAGVNSIAAPQYVPGSSFYNYWGGDSGGEGTSTDPAHYVSSNGTILNANPDGSFYDVYDDPSGGDHNKIQVNYKVENGMAVPTAAQHYYQAGNWVNDYRDTVRTAASVAAAGIGGYLGTLGEAGGVGEGVSGMDLAADAAAGTGNNIGFAGSQLGGGAGAFDGGADALYQGAGGGDSGLESVYNGGTSADKAALYGNQGYGQTGPSFWDKVQSGALRGGLTNGGITAAKGGDAGDIFKGAAIGAVTGGIGGGVSYANPAEYAGVTNPQYQNYVNSGVSSGINAGITGGNVQNALLGSAVGSGINAGANAGAGYVNDWMKDSGGNNVPDTTEYGQSSVPQNSLFGTLGNYSSAPQGFSNSDELNNSLGINTNNSTYNPNFDIPQVNQNTVSQNEANPLKDAVRQALGFTGITSPNGNVNGNAAAGGLQNLMGLYDAYQKRKQYGGLANGLSSLYTQDSPYAQMLRQQLSRSDAAAGRRSQVGPREVELQARLAALNAQMAPQLASLYGQRNQAQNMGMYNLASLFGNSGAGRGVMNYANNWLNSPSPTNYVQPGGAPTDNNGEYVYD